MVVRLFKSKYNGVIFAALFFALYVFLIALLGGCSAQNIAAAKEFHEMAMKTMKEGNFVGHYSFEVGGSEAGVKNSVYLDTGIKVKVDGDYDYRNTTTKPSK